MFRKGPIPAVGHGLFEYAAAILFIAAPFIFNFHDSGAKAISVAVGVAVLLFTGFSELPTGIAKSIPAAAHVLLDYVLGVLLVAMPFIAGFSGETGPTVFFIAMGVVWLVLAMATRYIPEPKPPRPQRRRFRRDEGLDDVPEFEVPPREDRAPRP